MCRLLVPGLALLMLVGCGWRADSSQAETAVQAKVEQAPVLVRTGRLSRGDVSLRLSVAADLEAVSRADSTAEIAGVVKAVLKREGDPVVTGEPVVRLVDDDLELAVEQKRIMLAQAKIMVEQADVAKREGTELARQKQVLKEKAQKEYDRLEKLTGSAEGGIVSREELEEKSYDLENARIDEATARITGERYELDYKQRIEEARLAEVDLRTAEYKLSRTVISSPIEGVISWLRVKPGEFVSTSAKVFSAVNLSRLEARLHVPQREVGRVMPGLDVELECEVFPDRQFRGRVDVVVPVVDEAQGTVEVLVSVIDSDQFLKPGMFVSGAVILETRRNVPLVPKKAISYENQEAVLFFVKDGRAHRYVLTPGYPRRDAVEVLAVTAADGTEIRQASDGSPTLDDIGELVLVGHDNLEEGTPVEVEI